jgi:hemerythrin
MADYATTHFRHEEQLMRRARFPGYDGHIKRHEEFTRKANELAKRADGKGFILTDRGYIPAMQQHGLSDRTE